MASIDERKAWMREHLHYEFVMLWHTYDKLCAPASADKRDGYAFYEAFVVHARNFYYFLTNGDGSNVKAKHYAENFKANGKEIEGKIGAMNMQVQHMGGARPSGDDDRRIKTAHCGTVARWIDKNFTLFLKELDDTYLQVWADTGAVAPDLILRPNYTITACTAFSSTSSMTLEELRAKLKLR
jgi:hypothetical protein